MATVTGASPDYMGSITVDGHLLDACGMRASDAVLVGNCRNGARFETYIFRASAGSGIIEVNGAAAHLVEAGDRVIILHFADMTDEEYARHRPTVLLIGQDNRISRTVWYEPDQIPGD